MKSTRPTVVISAENAAKAYWKAGEIEDEYIERSRLEAIAKIKETRKCGFLWRKTRPITDAERKELIEEVEEDESFYMQLISHNAASYYEISRSMKVLPKDQEVTVPVTIAQLAFLQQKGK